jgi:hypothetical protein
LSVSVPTIDALPGITVNEGELVWRDAHDRAVFFMKMLHSKHQVTSDSVRDIYETTGCPELGSREVAQRVKGDIVETSGKEG